MKPEKYENETWVEFLYNTDIRKTFLWLKIQVE
jgi:hypothetical protein